MNIRDEEQLQQYFERQMTSGQEQNFLIDVAARDDMRLAFRSQLELLKAVREDKDASGSPTFVRTKTLTALGLGGALVPSSLTEHEAQAAAIGSSSIWQSIGSAFRRPAVSITTGLLFGILGTAAFMPSNVNPAHETSVPANTIITSPAQTAPENVPAPITAEPVKTEPAKAIVTHNTASIRTAKKDPVEVVTKSKTSKVGVSTTITKPEDAGTK